MQKKHCYCAICGVPCGRVIDEISDDEYSYCPDILKLDDIYWMSDVKLLTVNRKTGRTATCNEPEHEGGRNFGHWSESRVLTHPDNFGRGVIKVYRITKDRPPVIPLHLSCLKLLQKASKDKIKLNLLHAALSRRCVKIYGMDPLALNYDYGQAKRFQTAGNWRVEKFSESIVMDPIEVDGTIVNGMLDEATRDPSTEPSPEDEYWKSNLYGNHGWFTMFLPSETQLKKRSINWRTLHFLIQDLGNDKGRHDSTRTRLQFRNRARVWLSLMEKERLISSSTVQSKISQFFVRPH
ncbi:uncharacterized protein FIESC28_02811 [Fusarium coffeatum]|uniref:Uncharacterized protein n=1 Tax=Fusarium coffeatum TaxID=231269 RepID=A0A366S4R0_9HYPO|nr:uncharacterized protein FIESC28_02811 [Fusarium coffeatum]RBR24321.1 hypothetical protein FIESC28_02811 [Fusarium coffeatum]